MGKKNSFRQAVFASLFFPSYDRTTSFKQYYFNGLHNPENPAFFLQHSLGKIVIVFL